jgi:hypothetical protein
MKIKTVTYRTNVITPNEKFRSKHVEATAAVGAKEDPADALIELAQWVHEQLGISRRPRTKLRSLGDE